MGSRAGAGQTQGIAAVLLRATLWRALWVFGRVRVIGVEHLSQGGQVLVSNHVGWADPIWIAYAAYPRVLHQMAKRELFRWPWAGWVIGALGAFPVDRGRPSPATLKYAVELLRQGNWLLIFPTGTQDQSQNEARRGAALIASMAQAPIVPVWFEGPTRLSLAHLIRRPTIVVRFGPPLEIGAGARDRRATVQLTADLDRAIQALAAGTLSSAA